MEQVLRGLQNIHIYIDDVLIHTDTHEKHLEALEQILMRLHQHHLKINLDKCLFGDKQVSYLGFTQTPKGIKPGEAKLKAIKNAGLPRDIKEIWSFMGLCNFFRNHIQDFAITAAPLFKLTRQDSGYLSGPLPQAALQAFQALQTQLSKQPALAFPRSEKNYLLITKAYTPNPDLPGGICATLAQRNEHSQIQIISHESRQLKENEKNYIKFLLETAAAAWGMDNFNKYLNGSKFTLYKDPVLETSLGTTQLKRLKTVMSEHDFEIKDKQKSDLPDSLKKGQEDTPQTHVGHPGKFNKTIHVDTFFTLMTPEKGIITITETISFKQGKVQASKLEKKINEWAPLERRVTCKNRINTFNPEVEQQWEQNQQELPEEEFINTVNFFYELQEPEHKKNWGDTNSRHLDITENYPETDSNSEDEDEPEYNLDNLFQLSDDQLTYQTRRKSISLCRHKLQGRTRCQRWRQQSRQHKQNWLPESEADQQIEIDLVNEDTDPEWAQLREMEEFLRLQRMELLR